MIDYSTMRLQMMKMADLRWLCCWWLVRMLCLSCFFRLGLMLRSWDSYSSSSSSMRDMLMRWWGRFGRCFTCGGRISFIFPVWIFSCECVSLHSYISRPISRRANKNPRLRLTNRGLDCWISMPIFTPTIMTGTSAFVM